MSRSLKIEEIHSAARTAWRPRRLIAAWVLLVAASVQPACLFHKKKPEEPKYPPVPLRCVLLPINVPEANAELRWVSMGGVVLMARLAEEAPDLEPVPLWESMSVAADSAGETRTFTPEIAAYAASRLTARWAIQGELLPARRGLRLRVDFIPAAASQVAFRYEAAFSPESLGSRMRQAFAQFLNYLSARPLPKAEADSEVPNLKELAQVLEQEYGWRVPADPGKAETTVAAMGTSRRGLSRILFSPTLYPILKSPAAGAAAPSAKPPGR